MAEMNEAYLYPYSAEYARQRGEESLWRASYLSNMDCKDAIRKAVWQHYDGAHLDGDCLAKVIQEFGYKRTAWVLANTIQQLEWGGQYSSENKEWASRIYIPPDKSHNLNFVVPIRSAVLNGVVDQYRAAYQALGLFSPNQCEPDSFEKLDYEGKVLVLSPDTLKESCWKPENQLWYAHDGFGCSPTAIGRSIRCTCLNDEEMARWNRTDFTGVLKEEFLPDWAREKLQELKLNKLQQMSRSEKEQALAMRINLAWDRYEMSLQTLSVSEVIDQIADVSAVWMCRDALLKDMELYSDEQLIFLLSLFDPLDQMRDHLAQEQEADQMEQVNDAIRCLQKELQEHDSASLYTFFDGARAYRDSFIDAGSGPIKKDYSIRLDIPDEAGSIAAVSTLLALNNISIKNIGIVHNREAQEGVLRIEFYEEDSITKAIQLLNRRGYVTHI